MAANQLIAPLPFLTLEAGATITVEAVNPTTGAAVSGVTVSNVALYAANVYPSDRRSEPDPLFSFNADDNAPGGP
jgi:hypothetical protein